MLGILVNIMNIGLDIHGVIDTYPEIFSEASKRWKSQGHTIHIMTGERWDTAVDTVNKCDIVFDKYLSITDYHLAKTGMNWKETGWWTDNEIWDATKGKYCEDKFIELVFDDTLRYWKYMPLYTRFMYVKKGMTVETVNAFIREIDLWIPTIHNPIYYKERYL
jgi:hypothetical protein